MTFKQLCAEGRQPSSFSAYCVSHGVDQNSVRQVLGDEFENIKTLPGYCRGNSRLYLEIYEGFKALCAQGRQPGSFSSYCKSFGVTWDKVHYYMKRHHLRVMDLPGYKWHTGPPRPKEIPFEDIIFEESGFLPADSKTISVKVDDHVAVAFPADTDVEVIVRFIKKIGKEAGDVES